MEALSEIARFCAQQQRRCADLGIATSELAISHVAIRTRTWREYVSLRDDLEQLSGGNIENVWNGRPISKLFLNEPVAVDRHRAVPLIELIPPFHQRVYRMGLEHVGYVVGPSLDTFGQLHRSVLTGQQFQSPGCEPYYVMFDDYTHVKFYEHSLGHVCLREGGRSDRFVHADWVPKDPDAGPYEVH